MSGHGHDDLEHLIDEALKKIEPGTAFDDAREKVNEATTKFTSSYDGKKIEGDATEAFNKAAQTYLEGAGIKADGADATHYGDIMRSWLGDDYIKALSAVKSGNKADVASAFNQAYVSNTIEKKVGEMLGKIDSIEDPEEKLKAYKDFSDKLFPGEGKTDYVKVIRSPQQAIGVYQDVTGKLNNYKVKPKGDHAHH